MEYEKLNNIYNTLNLVETKGQSTVLMAACLSTLREVLAAASARPLQDAPQEKKEG